MTALGTLHFASGPVTWLLAAVVLAGGGALAWWAYGRTPSLLARLLFGARLLALSLLALFFLNPVITVARDEKGGRTVAVLLDVSPSMAVRDSLYGQTRLEAARRLLFASGEGLAARLEERFPVTYYTFAETLQPAARRELERGGRPAAAATTRLVPALQALARAAPDLAAVVVFTDGRDLAPESPETLPAKPPVFCVALGSPLTTTAWKNTAVRLRSAPARALVGTRVQVSADVVFTGQSASPSRLVLSEGERTVAARRLNLRPGCAVVELAFTPREPGEHEYRLFLEPVAGETFRGDNEVFFTLTTDNRRLRVLYFEAKPRWQYRYLREALSRDPGLQVTFVVKTAPDRLLEQGKSPVTLAGGLPAEARALRAFDVLILGDVARADLADAQVRAIHIWVSRMGGGLLFLGGGLAFGPDGIGGTPIEGVLPASLDPRGGELQGTFQVVPTQAGRVHPALQGIAELFAGPQGPLFPVRNVYRLGGLKPGAALLLLARGPGNMTAPLLVVQRFGAGKTALCASDTTWCWWLGRRDAGGEALFTRLWAQLLRWLSGREDPRQSGTRPILSLARSRLAPGELLAVQVRGKNLRPVPFRVVSPGGTVTTLNPAAAAGGRLLTAQLRPVATGRYRVEVKLPRTPPLRAHFQVLPARLEGEDVALDAARLEAIAARTGGAVLDAARAGNLPRYVGQAAGLKTERREIAPRERPEFFAALVALLSLEWWIRRKRYGI